MLKDLYLGASFLFRGFSLLTKPGLKRFAILPVMINVIVFSLLTWIGIHYFNDLLNWLLPAGEGWWEALARTLLWLLFAFSALLILFFTFSIVSNLIGSPFNSLLSEKVERYIEPSRPVEVSTNAGGFLSEIPSSVLNEIRKIFYYLLFSALILSLSVMPLANIIFPFVWIIFTSWMLTLEYIGYPMENHGSVFADVRKAAGSKLGLSMGFGAAAMLCTLIPLVNLVIMPAAVAGGTLMWLEADLQNGKN
ncbi:MAG: sulfate transporter CysZ [Nitrospirota bacterium]|nr:MAG: sulfate transporter CysZ [Nitrospirota bacterium]